MAVIYACGYVFSVDVEREVPHMWPLTREVIDLIQRDPERVLVHARK